MGQAVSAAGEASCSFDGLGAARDSLRTYCLSQRRDSAFVVSFCVHGTNEADQGVAVVGDVSDDRCHELPAEYPMREVGDPAGRHR